MPWPKPVIPTKYHIVLAQIVAETSWLPDPAVVRVFPGPVFPTIRKKKDAEIGTSVTDASGVLIGMYDNNTTPKLAIGWTHGLASSTKGWTIAHIWPSSEDVNSYTNLANLALVPEALSTTTDKDGPLTSYLRWHAWEKYGWHPTGTPVPDKKPAGYSAIPWRYLKGLPHPKEAVQEKLESITGQKLINLRKIMREPGLFSYLKKDGIKAQPR